MRKLLVLALALTALAVPAGAAAHPLGNFTVNSFSRIAESVLFPNVNVGRGAQLRRCIVDKGVRIPPGEVIGEDPAGDRKRFTVSEGGVVVVTREDVGQRDEFDVGVAAVQRVATGPAFTARLVFAEAVQSRGELQRGCVFA